MTQNPDLPALKQRSAAGSAAQKVVHTGVFTAVYFVTFFSLGMLGFFGPQVTFFALPLTLLLEGTVIIFMLNKVRSFGSLTALGIIVGALMMITGHAWTTLAATTVTALVGDLVAKTGGYQDEKRNIAAYTILQLWYISPWLPIFYAADSYYATIAQQMGQGYADKMRALFTPTALIILFIASFFISILGGWIGTKIVKGNFQKAGLA